MGVLFVLGHCVACGHLFAFHPERVPSVRMVPVDGQWVPDPEGGRHPLCASCWQRFNANRVRAGLPPHPTLPGAYEPEEV